MNLDVYIGFLYDKPKVSLDTFMRGAIPYINIDVNFLNNILTSKIRDKIYIPDSTIQPYIFGGIVPLHKLHAGDYILDKTDWNKTVIPKILITIEGLFRILPNFNEPYYTWMNYFIKLCYGYQAYLSVIGHEVKPINRIETRFPSKPYDHLILCGGSYHECILIVELDPMLFTRQYYTIIGTKDETQHIYSKLRGGILFSCDIAVHIECRDHKKVMNAILNAFKPNIHICDNYIKLMGVSNEDFVATIRRLFRS